MPTEPWEIYLTAGVDTWLNELAATNRRSHEQVNMAILHLSECGPALGRPLVDSVVGSRLSTARCRATKFCCGTSRPWAAN